MSQDGIEQQYQSNHLGHFKLVSFCIFSRGSAALLHVPVQHLIAISLIAAQIHHLLPKLRAAGSARVISLSSRAHLRHPGAIDYERLKNETAESYEIEWMAYGRSKLSQILVTKVRAVFSTRGLGCVAHCRVRLLRRDKAAVPPEGPAAAAGAVARNIVVLMPS